MIFNLKAVLWSRMLKEFSTRELRRMVLIIHDRVEFECGSKLFDKLYDYYSDEMPYGVQKARTGTPDEWIYDRLCYEFKI